MPRRSENMVCSVGEINVHTAQLLHEALNLARRVGFVVRPDYFGGSGGGACQLGAQKVLFLDLALWPDEQLQHVADVLIQEPALEQQPISDQLRQVLQSRQHGNRGKVTSLGWRQTIADSGSLGKSE